MSVTAQDIGRVIGLHGDGLPVVSLYAQIPLDPAERGGLMGRVRSLLADVREAADGQSVDHAARMSLREDLQRIEEAFRSEGRWPGTRSVAVFACSGRGVFEEIRLPRPVRDRAVVDETAFVRPVLAVLDQYPRCCVVLVDAAVTHVWELYQGELSEVRTLRGRKLRDPDYARWRREFTTHNRARELEKEHYRRTLQLLDELFRVTPYDVLVVGGLEQEVPGFVEFLPQRLRNLVAGTFVVDQSTDNREEIKKRAGEVLSEYERKSEREAVGHALETAAAGGRAVVGPDDCLWAGSVAAVDRLLVKSDAVLPGVVCDASGWLGTSGDKCPMCGEAVRKTPDVLDELVQVVIEEGGAIDHVSQDTRLREDLVAAELRFPLPPVPTG
ncbi:hypothetical protein [Kribbella sp. HUAS MG21]|uniref:Peptide chain release factor subunit 1 n=1 Tax=Kribbella sp. HUAS MG21 TaxID=3160966 RepID=A0AAU7TEY5_9ACTN